MTDAELKEAWRQGVEFGKRIAIPVILFCPHCKMQHIERGKWKITPHRTHACEGCRKPFTPSSFRTFGVEQKDLKFDVIEEDG